LTLGAKMGAFFVRYSREFVIIVIIITKFDCIFIELMAIFVVVRILLYLLTLNCSKILFYFVNPNEYPGAAPVHFFRLRMSLKLMFQPRPIRLVNFSINVMKLWRLLPTLLLNFFPVIFTNFFNEPFLDISGV